MSRLALKTNQFTILSVNESFTIRVKAAEA
jgi:hypothetical protein